MPKMEACGCNLVFDGVLIAKTSSQGDAYRLAALWNACVGIQTDVLTDGKHTAVVVPTDLVGKPTAGKQFVEIVRERVKELAIYRANRRMISRD